MINTEKHKYGQHLISLSMKAEAILLQGKGIIAFWLPLKSQNRKGNRNTESFSLI